MLITEDLHMISSQMEDPVDKSGTWLMISTQEA